MRWAFAVLVMLLLAGCGGGKSSSQGKFQLADGSQVSLDLPPEQTPAEDDIRGAISGVVVDDAVYPVAGATVTVLSLRLNATTDDTGRFVFEAMPPGIVALQASKDGHEAGMATVEVRSGQVAKSVLMAPRIPYQEPYHTVHSIQGAYNAIDNVRTEPREHLVALDPSPQAVIVESLWEGVQGLLLDPLRYAVQPESEPDREDRGTGSNPLRLEYDLEWLPVDEYAVRVSVHPEMWTNTPTATGRIFVTIFYLEPPPADWSFVEGDQ